MRAVIRRPVERYTSVHNPMHQMGQVAALRKKKSGMIQPCCPAYAGRAIYLRQPQKFPLLGAKRRLMAFLPKQLEPKNIPIKCNLLGQIADGVVDKSELRLWMNAHLLHLMWVCR